MALLPSTVTTSPSLLIQTSATANTPLASLQQPERPLPHVTAPPTTLLRCPSRLKAELPGLANRGPSGLSGLLPTAALCAASRRAGRASLPGPCLVAVLLPPEASGTSQTWFGGFARSAACTSAWAGPPHPRAPASSSVETDATMTVWQFEDCQYPGIQLLVGQVCISACCAKCCLDTPTQRSSEQGRAHLTLKKQEEERHCQNRERPLLAALRPPQPRLEPPARDQPPVAPPLRLWTQPMRPRGWNSGAARWAQPCAGGPAPSSPEY